MNNIGRTRQFGLIVMIVLAMGLLSSTASATVLYQTSFDNNSSASPGDPVDGLTVDGLTWTQGGAASGDYYVGDATTVFPVPGKGFGSASVGCLYGSWSGVGANDIYPQVQFNTDSSAGNEIVRVEFYVMPSNGSSSAGYIEAGLWQQGTLSRQAMLGMTEGDGLIQIRTEAGWTSTGQSYTDEAWYHAALVFDYAASTVKLYIKQVADGDTSPLTESDLATFGGSDTVAITPGSTPYASTFGMHAYKNYTLSAYDNLTITTVPRASTTLYITSFNNNSSASPGDPVDGLTVDGLTWTQGGAASGDYYVGDATTVFSVPGKGFGSASVGCLYGSYSGVGANDIYPQAQFNTNSLVGNEIVRVEFYILPSNGSSSAGYIEAGLWQQGTFSKQATLFLTEGDGLIQIRTEAGVTASSMLYTDDAWHHAALVFDYAASTVKLYIKQVAAGDTSPLTESDLVTFGGSNTVAITPGSTPYASTFGVHAYKNYMLSAYDNLEITAIYVPPSGTLIIIN